MRFFLLGLLALFQYSHSTAQSVLPADKQLSTVVINKSAASAQSNGVYTFCDTDNDGFLPIDIGTIKQQVLSENASTLVDEQGIYISTASAGLSIVTGLLGTPQITNICTSPSSGWGMLDIAVNQNGELYAALGDQIHKINGNTCISEIVYNYPISGDITSLSFDRNANMYAGGFDTWVYRLVDGSYNQMVPWHDFQSGFAAGDFVMYGSKMYIAWRNGGTCQLLEVTVDANMDYTSSIVLGVLPNDTFGLASELGILYGVTPAELYKINLDNMTFDSVLTNVSGPAWYGAAGKNEGVAFDINAYETLTDAQNAIDALPDTWTNTISGGQIIFVTITNSVNGQSITVPVTLNINLAPHYVSPIEIVHCANDADAGTFDLRATESGIVGNQTGVDVQYFDNLQNAEANLNPLPDVYTISGLSKAIVVRLTSPEGCSSYFQFDLRILAAPIFTRPDDLIFCDYPDNLINVAVPLDDQIQTILNNQSIDDNAVTFHHSLNAAMQGIGDIGSPYSLQLPQKEIFVRVENLLTGCFSTGSFLINVIQENQNVEFSYTINVNDWNPINNSIQIDGNLNLEYSLNGYAYTSIGLFDKLPTGEYTVFIRDKISCGVASELLVLMSYPRFFTPNQDGFNDTWRIRFSESEPDLTVEIYDRYGKLLTTIGNESAGWDGTFNNAIMPASDYWFVVHRQNGDVRKGHFTLKR